MEYILFLLVFLIIGIQNLWIQVGLALIAIAVVLFDMFKKGFKFNW